MKINKLPLLLLLLLAGFITACSEADENLDIPLPGLGGETWTKGTVDTWLDNNYVKPYNIEVKYRFDRYELALNKVLTPPREDKVIPVMETIKKTWIEPYEQEGGADFIKRLSPKQFVLVGSAQYNSDGTITLGTAEGGRKVVLYVINDFDKKNKPEVKQMLHTIEHEYGHILHQTIMYPEEYKRVTTNYTANWYDYSLADARSRGFITEYARNNPDDDFVEMISMMLIEGRTGFNAIVNSAPASAQPLLKRKEELVVRYFKEAWNIDFYSLQTRAQAAINAL
jgi:substrate import-associated zinc metallohydrolase lipoprotein